MQPHPQLARRLLSVRLFGQGSAQSGGPHDERCHRLTAEMAKGDAAVIGDLQDLFIKTRAARRVRARGSAGVPPARDLPRQPPDPLFGGWKRVCKDLCMKDLNGVL